MATSPRAAPSLLDTLVSSDVLSLFSDERVAAACLDYLNAALADQGTARPNGGGVMMCLASVLDSLAECDERTIFSVRKINKLGFKSHGALRRHFSQFGTVLAVYFLPYRYKPDTASIRPSSMAFIRMATAEAVASIFAAGELHYIRDCPVTVQPFTRAP